MFPAVLSTAIDPSQRRNSMRKKSVLAAMVVGIAILAGAASLWGKSSQGKECCQPLVFVKGAHNIPAYIEGSIAYDRTPECESWLTAHPQPGWTLVKALPNELILVRN